MGGVENEKIMRVPLVALKMKENIIAFILTNIFPLFFHY